MCNHEISLLMGTADGVVCRGCGRLFANFDEILADRGEAPQAAPVEPQEKPKRTTRKKKEDA